MSTPNINKLLAADRRSCKYGAPLGDTDYVDNLSTAGPLYLQRVNLVDGDYAPDGTYWGCSPREGSIYCAFDVTADQVRAYVRAHTRSGAKAALVQTYPEITFVR